jgi:DNA modification methylase
MERIAHPTGKTEESLEHSARVKAQFLKRLGVDRVPNSILLNDRSDRAMDDIVESGRDASFNKKDNARRVSNRYMRDKFEISGKSVRAGKDAVLSRFPQNIGRLFVSFYCPEHGVVYDPFAGHNSRMELTYRQHRSYIGIDVSHDFMIANKKIAKFLLDENRLDKNYASITLLEQSSAEVKLCDDDLADFTLTSPPYWDIEYYGDEEEQLGNAKTYNRFIQLLTQHVRENYRILKPGSYCAWFINDFVKDKIFYPYHVDLTTAFLRVGFELANIYVVDLGRPLTESFVQGIIQTKRFPKRHEFCILAKKPGVNAAVEEHIKNLIKL